MSAYGSCHQKRLNRLLLSLQAKEQSKKAQELNRFVHYYSRYKNHLNSYEVRISLNFIAAAVMERFRDFSWKSRFWTISPQRSTTWPKLRQRRMVSV